MPKPSLYRPRMTKPHLRGFPSTQHKRLLTLQHKVLCFLESAYHQRKPSRFAGYRGGMDVYYSDTWLELIPSVILSTMRFGRFTFIPNRILLILHLFGEAP